MLLSSISSPSSSLTLRLQSKKRRRRRRSAASDAITVSVTRASLGIGPEEIVGVVHNKVLVAAALSTAVGQLSKPLTSALGGGGFDLRKVVRSGGMPSTHSASVASAVTSLGLQRGFSDSIFGMSVVFAAIVMYDAQGVRREVGAHSRAFNNLMELGAPSSSEVPPKNTEDINSTENPEKQSRTDQTQSYRNNIDRNRMNESIGHTELQVFVGALLGFLVSIAFHNFS